MSDYTELVKRAEATYARWNSPTNPDGVPDNGEIVIEQSRAIEALMRERDEANRRSHTYDAANAKLIAERNEVIRRNDELRRMLREARSHPRIEGQVAMSERDDEGMIYQQYVHDLEDTLRIAQAENARLREVLTDAVMADARENFMRTADAHSPECICLRCAMDRARAALEDKP